MFLYDAYTDFLDILFPKECLVCGSPWTANLLCKSCLPMQPRIQIDNRCIRCWTETLNLNSNSLCEACLSFPPNFRSMRYLWPYNDHKIRHLIRVMKFKPSRRLCSWAGVKLAENLNIFPKHDWDIIIPIPVSPSNIQKRLFNQCDLIAKSLKTNSPSLISSRISSTTLTVRDKKTAQAQLPLQRRIGNVRGKLYVKTAIVENKRILLVEDVITSGATIATACQVLSESGARSIDVLALTRAKSWLKLRYRVHRSFPACAYPNIDDNYRYEKVNYPDFSYQPNACSP